MSRPNEVWDAGLQPERTGLAWQRAALALLGLGLVALRLGWGALAGWALLPAGLVVVGSAALMVGAHRRYRRMHHSLAADAALGNGGRLALATALVTLLVALLGFSLLIARLVTIR